MNARGTRGATWKSTGVPAEVTVRVVADPFSFEVHRGDRPLVRAGGAWVCDGEVRDQFVQLSEGVIADEARTAQARAQRAGVAGEDLRTGAGRGALARGGAATVLSPGDPPLDLALWLTGGRAARLLVALLDAQSVSLTLCADGEPLRLALDWAAAPGEAFAGLGARHHPCVDHAGREIQLGADRRYTGPDCPPDLLAQGGIPQGDCAPCPWLVSSAGWSAWIDGAGNGTRFDLDGRPTLSARAGAGPLRVVVHVDASPAARLRRYLRACGLPALLPEWGYGFWKSRDVYGHQDEVVDDVAGCERHGIPLDAVVLDSPWETQYNTWEPNPHQFPDFTGMVGGFRARGVRTVVWVTPWVNLDSSPGQIPPDPGSRALHAAPADTYAEGEREGHFVADPEHPERSFVARWWMGTGSPVDLRSPAAEAWWRAQAVRALGLGVEGLKADDGEGYYLPDGARFADGATGAQAAWEHGTTYRRSMQRALDEVHPGRGVLFGRCGWTGQQALGHLWGGDQASDFWSLRVLVAAGLSAASSGFSNWSHDVGGYLGHRLVDRCPPELLVRWAQLGCFTPLMHAHGRMEQEPWTYDRATLDAYREAVLLHERLVPYLRAAAATAARCGLPMIRPLSLLQPGERHAWRVADAFALGPSLWVAPVLEDGAREREVVLPRGRWIETWSGEAVEGGRTVIVPAPLERIPVWVREGALIVTYPGEHVRRRPRGRARGRAPAGGDAVGPAPVRARPGPPGRRHRGALRARALVGLSLAAAGHPDRRVSAVASGRPQAHRTFTCRSVRPAVRGSP
ncbi:MAG TPA: glycoside hydrolase family 31 protein, partial [Solirubrobacteraceae bacterium]|nr:glycoside hydrolase family 31 protein [Solirubrobacteraceae bacterium]